MNITRRSFLKASTLLSTHFTIGFFINSNAHGRDIETFSHNSYLKIKSDNTIEIMCSRAEMGQGVYTSLAALVCEELEVGLDSVKISFAPVSQDFINDYYGMQLTGASTSVRDAWVKLRKVGAIAKTMLIQAASNKWNVRVEDLKAESGFIFGPNNKKIKYSELISEANKLEIPKDVVFKSENEWKLIGSTKLKRLDTQNKVKGKTNYGIDTKLKGMLYATIKMPDVFDAKVKSFDATKASKVPGVKKIFKLDPIMQLTGLMPGGVVVVADTYWNAKKAKELLIVDWDIDVNNRLDTNKMFDEMNQVSDDQGLVFRESGNYDQGINDASSKITSTYKFPFISHSPLEPVNTTADYKGGTCTIISPHQLQGILPPLVGAALDIEPQKVEIITTFLGGGFGRKLGADFVVQAALISKEIGKPVNLIWDREDDMTHDSFRPASLIKITGGLDKNGDLTAMKYNQVMPHISSYQFPPLVHEGIDPHAVEGIDNFPYKTKDIKFSTFDFKVPISIGYLRSVSNAQNCTAVESFIDECAYSSGKDPIEYRIDLLNMKNVKYEHSGMEKSLPDAKFANSSLSIGTGVGSRMKKVLEVVRDKSNWNSKKDNRIGRGVALLEAYNTVLATVVEVEVSDNYDVNILKVTAAVDAGQLIHPDQAKAQIEGSINYGLEIAKRLEISIVNGVVRQDNFDTYQVGRMYESPKIDVYFIKSKADFVGGIGEPAVPVIQPALGNAIFDACGKRCKILPYTPENIIRS